MMRPTTTIAVIAVSILIGSSLTSLHSQTFSEPSGAFPNNNTATPINISNQAQTKQGKLTLQNTLSLSNNRAVNLKDPINPQDAVTKAYVDKFAKPGLVCDGSLHAGVTNMGCVGSEMFYSPRVNLPPGNLISSLMIQQDQVSRSRFCVEEGYIKSTEYTPTIGEEGAYCASNFFGRFCYWAKWSSARSRWEVGDNGSYTGVGGAMTVTCGN